jgi:hypothetical protein
LGAPIGRIIEVEIDDELGNAFAFGHRLKTGFRHLATSQIFRVT